MAIISAIQSTTPCDVVVSGGVSLSTSATSGFIYITQSSIGTWTSSGGAAAIALPTPPITNAGAAIIWDAVSKRIGIGSTVSNTWMWTLVLTSS